MIQQKYLDEYITEYCKKVDITLEQLKSKSRKRDLVEKRMIAAYFLRNKVGMTFLDVGKYLHKNHASVIHYINLTERFLGIYPHIKRLYNIADELYDEYSEKLIISYDMPYSISEKEEKLIEILLENNTKLREKIINLENYINKINDYEKQEN